MVNMDSPPPHEAPQVSSPQVSFPHPTSHHITHDVVKGHVKQAQGLYDLLGPTPGAAWALVDAPLPPRARGSAYWAPCLAQHPSWCWGAQQPSWCWGNRHPLLGLYGSPCNKDRSMDPGPPLEASGTQCGALLSTRDQDTTSWYPSITLPSSHGKRSHDPAGIASPTSNYRELTADDGTSPADHCNPLSNRGGNTHIHYEPTAHGMHQNASHMTKQKGQTHPSNYPRHKPSTSASISWHTKIQTHGPVCPGR